MDGSLASLGGWVVTIISSAGYLGVAGLMAIESACLPLPSEIIMPFAGYLVSTGRFNLVFAATAGAVGCNVGSTVAYFIGAHGGRPLAERWGRYVLLRREHLDRADRFFHRFGGPAVLIARVLPVVRTFIALPAGIARMPQVPFQFYTFVGSWPWCYALAYVGYVLGKRWNTDPRLQAIMHRFDFVVIGLLAIGVAWFVWRQLRGTHRACDLER
ncbi:DedA family protein [Rhodopila sp.]|uniref:DedA family protein n=1 Tax=Rhodopila sp. TaxID=2480087 RepID=UPI003D1182EA